MKPIAQRWIVNSWTPEDSPQTTLMVLCPTSFWKEVGKSRCTGIPLVRIDIWLREKLPQSPACPAGRQRTTQIVPTQFPCDFIVEGWSEREVHRMSMKSKAMVVSPTLIPTTSGRLRRARREERKMKIGNSEIDGGVRWQTSWVAISAVTAFCYSAEIACTLD